MKVNLFFILTFALLLSCKQNHAPKIEVTDPTRPQQSNLNPGHPRALLIAELSKFSSAVSRKNKEEILSYFTFPLADTAVSFFEVDSLFDKQRQEHNGAITHSMFLNSFDSIFSLTEMNEFNNLFKAVDLNGLKTKDEISKEVHSKNEGCYYIYSVSISGSEVTLQYGTNTDDEYLKAHTDEGEVCGEYAAIWVFKFEGEKIRFLKHQVAG